MKVFEEQRSGVAAADDHNARNFGVVKFRFGLVALVNAHYHTNRSYHNEREKSAEHVNRDRKRLKGFSDRMEKTYDEVVQTDVNHESDRQSDADAEQVYRSGILPDDSVKVHYYKRNKHRHAKQRHSYQKRNEERFYLRKVGNIVKSKRHKHSEICKEQISERDQRGLV